MRRMLRRTAVAAAAGVAAAISSLLFGVDREDIVVDALLVYLAAVAAVAVARIAATALPSPRGVVRRALERRPAPDAIPDALTRIESLVALAQASQLDFHVRLRPLLTEAAAVGYTATVGLPGEALPPAAEAVFSPATWELVRPDRPRPEGPGDHGIPTRTLSSALDELESILPP